MIVLLLCLAVLLTAQAYMLRSKGFSAVSRFAIKMTTKSEEFIISSAKLSAKDVTKTSSFYTDILGLESLNAGTFKLSGTTCIEISQLDSDSAMMGDGFAGFGVSRTKDVTEDIMSKAKDMVKVELGDYGYGAAMIPDEDEMKIFDVRYGVLADPNGFKVEVIEDSSASKIVLNVVNLENSIEFYTTILGMTLFRKRSNVNSLPKHASICAKVGYTDEKDVESSILELNYNYATEKLNHGVGFDGLTLKIKDMDSMKAKLTTEKIDTVVSESGALVIEDPNGYKISLLPM